MLMQVERMVLGMLGNILEREERMVLGMMGNILEQEELMAPVLFDIRIQ